MTRKLAILPATFKRRPPISKRGMNRLAKNLKLETVDLGVIHANVELGKVMKDVGCVEYARGVWVGCLDKFEQCLNVLLRELPNQKGKEAMEMVSLIADIVSKKSNTATNLIRLHAAAEQDVAAPLTQNVPWKLGVAVQVNNSVNNNSNEPKTGDGT